jgi:hypothetical protein
VNPSMEAAGKTSLFCTLRRMTRESALCIAVDACNEPVCSTFRETQSDRPDERLNKQCEGWRGVGRTVVGESKRGFNEAWWYSPPHEVDQVPAEKEVRARSISARLAGA